MKNLRPAWERGGSTVTLTHTGTVYQKKSGSRITGQVPSSRPTLLRANLSGVTEQGFVMVIKKSSSERCEPSSGTAAHLLT